MMTVPYHKKLVAMAAAIGITVSPRATEEELDRASQALIKHKGYLADTVLEAQDVHVRIVAIKYGGFILLGGVEEVGGIWLTTQGQLVTLHVTDLDDTTIAGQVGGPAR
jgi:hypothetical protein